MCKEVFYISPFNSELTAAIIGQSLAPAILAGTWGVIGAAFLQNNEVHRDAASAFQHPDKAKVRCFWHPENSFAVICTRQSLLRPTAALPMARAALPLTGMGSERSKLLLTTLHLCCEAEELDRTWHSQGSVGRKYCMWHCMLFQSAFGQKPTTTESLQHALWYQVPVEG